jgi:hypothetical protein
LILWPTRLTSRGSQPPSRQAVAAVRRLMALSVPLSRLTPRVGGVPQARDFYFSQLRNTL